MFIAKWIPIKKLGEVHMKTDTYIRQIIVK